MREKDGTCSTVFIFYFFPFFLSSVFLVPALFWPVCPREKDGAAPIPNLDKVPRFPYLSLFLILPHSLILFLYSYFFLFFFCLYTTIDTIVVYIVWCVCIAVKTPSVKLKFFFSN